MHLSAITTGLLAIGGLAGAAPTIEKRALTAQQTVNSINGLVTQLQQLRTTANAIPTPETSLGGLPSNKFGPLITGFQQLSQSLQTTIISQEGTQPFGDADGQRVCTAYSTFATTGTSTFTTIESKGGVFDSIFNGPVATSLRQIEAQVDSFSFGVLNVVPACVQSATASKEPLDAAIRSAICSYTPGGNLPGNLDVPAFC